MKAQRSTLAHLAILLARNAAIAGASIWTVRRAVRLFGSPIASLPARKRTSVRSELAAAGNSPRGQFGQILAVWYTYWSPAVADDWCQLLGGAQPSLVRVQHAVARQGCLERRQPLRRRMRAAQAAGGHTPATHCQLVEGAFDDVDDAPALDHLETEQRPLARQRHIPGPARRMVSAARPINQMACPWRSSDTISRSAKNSRKRGPGPHSAGRSSTSLSSTPTSSKVSCCSRSSSAWPSA